MKTKQAYANDTLVFILSIQFDRCNDTFYCNA